MIYYICHYSCDEIENECRICAPAAQYKAAYIITTLAKVQSDCIEVVSPCISELQKPVKGSKTKIENNVMLRTFSSFNSSNKVRRLLGRILTNINVILYLLRNIKEDDIVIVYHSLSLMNMVKLIKKIKRCEIILEVEEIYSDVTNDTKRRQDELDYFALADKYLVITNLLNSEINTCNKPCAISHGSYESMKVLDNSFDNSVDDIIHVVYAGTFDYRKGGAIAAIEATEFLPERYHVHILGFGNKENTQKVKDAIQKVSEKAKASISFEGHLKGEEYLRFIQKCDIGLSTQDPSKNFNTTSFPSKILSYMANGLRVVSIRIPAIEGSAIGKYMYYYDIQSPEIIADAIVSVNMNDSYDGRKIISELDLQFKKDLKMLLEE